jgi:hypothetical protein
VRILSLRSLSIGHIAIDQDETPAGNCVPPYLDNVTVWSCALQPKFLVGMFKPCAEFCLNVVCAELATFCEETDVIGIAGPLLYEFIGQIEDALEVHVPSGKSQIGIEHSDTVAHVVERDAQFCLALADLVQQPCVVHCDHGLRGETLQ